MESWTKEEVGQFIAEIGFPQFSNAFVENDIDGQLFTILDKSALNELGVNDSSVADTILSKREFYGNDTQPEESAPPAALKPQEEAAKPRRKKMQFASEADEEPATSSPPSEKQEDPQPPKVDSSELEALTLNANAQVLGVCVCVCVWVEIDSEQAQIVKIKNR